MKTTLKEILHITNGKLIYQTKDAVVEDISIDSRTIKPKEAFIALKGNNFDGHNFIREAISKGSSCVIVSNADIMKSISDEFKKDNLNFPIVYVKDTLKALTDLAHYNRKRFPLPLIAITGTNGKTTAKDMAASVLSLKYNVLKNIGTQNNKIGVSLTLLKLNKDHDIAVLELGTNHPGEIEELAKITLPNVGIITNIGAGHLEFFSNIKNVFKEKSSLLKNLRNPAISIINIDDPFLSNVSKRGTFSFGIKNKCDVKADNIVCKNDKLFFIMNARYEFVLNSIAEHNVYNALSVLTCALIFGIDMDSAFRVLANFEFPSSRMSIINFEDIIILDDTYNSNPVSLKAAIEVLAAYPTNSQRILIMADMLELGRVSSDLHRDIGRIIARSNVDRLITVGEFARCAASEARKICKDNKKIDSCNSSGEAVSILLETMTRGDVVLVKGSRAMHMEKVIESLRQKDT